MKTIRDLVESMKQKAHDECDDGFYSCPKAENYFGSAPRDRCYCGMDRRNQDVARLVINLELAGSRDEDGTHSIFDHVLI